MTLIFFVSSWIDRFQIARHQPEAYRAIVLSAIAVDLSIVALVISIGVIR